MCVCVCLCLRVCVYVCVCVCEGVCASSTPVNVLLWIIRSYISRCREIGPCHTICELTRPFFFEVVYFLYVCVVRDDTSVCEFLLDSSLHPHVLQDKHVLNHWIDFTPDMLILFEVLKCADIPEYRYDPLTS